MAHINAANQPLPMHGINSEEGKKRKKRDEKQEIVNFL